MYQRGSNMFKRAKKELVVYHRNCKDGYCSAYLWWKYMNTYAEFKSAQYGEDPMRLEEFENRHVVILDFSYPREYLEKINQVALSLRVLDHHETARKELEGLPYCTFDMTKCGARLTWEEICRVNGCPHKQLSAENPPLRVAYVEDGDLWKWELPYSKEINAALDSYPKFFDVWDKMKLDSLKEDGKAILRYQGVEISRRTYNPTFSIIGGYEVPCVNTTVLISEILHELCREYPFSAGFFVAGDEKIVYSLRSVEGGMDVSKIAKTYGGGGHPHAAGFTHPTILPLLRKPK